MTALELEAIKARLMEDINKANSMDDLNASWKTCIMNMHPKMKYGRRKTIGVPAEETERMLNN